MKKILFILFATQFILAPYIIKSYGANLIEDNYEYSGVNQSWYLQPIITQYFIDNKSEIWLLFLIAHSKR